MNKKEKYEKKEKYDYILRWAKKIMGIDVLGGKCSNCGNGNVLLLEFHHFEDDKEFEIGKKINSGMPWSRIKSEIEKCILLCSNCHKEILYGKDKRYCDFKKSLLNYKNTFACEKCGYSGKNYSSLVFHHLLDKKFSISYSCMRNKDGVSLENIIEEIKKCSILCSNCHKITHFDCEKFIGLKEKIYAVSKGYIERPSPIDINIVKNKYLKENKGIVEIAKELGCAKSTISRIINVVLNIKTL